MYVNHPLVKDNAIKLRQYQEHVTARAIDANTLVVLPTGLGKTIIAAMVAAHRLYENKESKVLFLAPTKPLVVQHQKTFGEMLKVDNTVVLTGAVPIKERKKLWKDSRIIFATPQTIENDLMRGLSLKDVSLVIFDEAHRAGGNYAYVYIAKKYVEQAENQLIMGLTASPSSEKEKIDEICGNLFIRQVEAKTEHDGDVKPYVQDVETQWIRVELPQEFNRIKELIEDVLRGYVRELKSMEYLESAELKKINKRKLLALQGEIRREITAGMDSYRAASVAAAAIKVNHALELLETQGINALDMYLMRLKKQKTKAASNMMNDARMRIVTKMVHDMNVLDIDHPKLEALVNVVKQHMKDKVIVFTQYRDSVEKIINKLNENDILAHAFVGQAKKGDKAGMTQKEQIKILDNFRNGMYTALVATSVAEEGLDIPKVDVVIFYEPVASEIRSIQRRGRTGRSEVGKVVILMAKKTRDEGYYWASVHKERRMGKLVRELRDGMETRGQKVLADYVKADDKAAVEDDNTEEITIYADHRERNTELIESLKSRGPVNLEMKQLKVGDFILSDRIIAERKTIGDFLQSIIDKRLLAQAPELVANCSNPIMILEGREDIYSLRDIHPNAIAGAMAALATDFGISIIPSPNAAETGRMLYAIAKREQIDEKREVALRGDKKPLLFEEKQRFIVESLPNVSAVLARRLLEHFGSVEDVIKATEKQLMEVEGIGKKKAEAIRKVVRSKYKGCKEIDI